MSNERKKCVIIVHSYHHMNTEKLAKAMALVLDAEVMKVETVNKEIIDEYEVIGFGAGIDSGKHYPELLNYAESLEFVNGKKAFIFSTSAVQGADKVYKDHKALRNLLSSKGFKLMEEFSCKGFNTNSFLKYFGGMNKGRPNAEDLALAKQYAEKIKQIID